MVGRSLLVGGSRGESVRAVVRIERLSGFDGRTSLDLDVVSLGAWGGDGGAEDSEDGNDLGEMHLDGLMEGSFRSGVGEYASVVRWMR